MREAAAPCIRLLQVGAADEAALLGAALAMQFGAGKGRPAGNSPCMRSEVDSVVFGRDMDGSDESVPLGASAVFSGAAGCDSRVINVGAEPPPPHAPHPNMRSSVDSIIFGRDLDGSDDAPPVLNDAHMDGAAGLASMLTASRAENNLTGISSLGISSRSVVDELVFGRDMDGSQGLSHPSKAAQYDGAHGRPSDPTLGSPLRRVHGDEGESGGLQLGASPSRRRVVSNLANEIPASGQADYLYGSEAMVAWPDSHAVAAAAVAASSAAASAAAPAAAACCASDVSASAARACVVRAGVTVTVRARVTVGVKVRARARVGARVNIGTNLCRRRVRRLRLGLCLGEQLRLCRKRRLLLHR